MSRKIIAFVHAKGRSERIYEKNLQVVGNRPLFGHAIVHAKRSDIIDEVIIDSDNQKILDIGKQFGATPLLRPDNMETATGDELAYYAASCRPESDIIVQILPTSPFTTTDTIERAIYGIRENPGVDSAVAVRQEVFYQWNEGKPAYHINGVLPDSQDMEPIVYETNGLYAMHTAYVLKHKKRINPDACIPICVSKLEAVDINTWEDLLFARLLWKALRKDRKSYGFDIDGTITLYDAKGDYEESIPNKEMVERINKLYDEGHYITITTSRGHSRGTREILLKQAEKQLKKWGVKYHRLVPKTYYDHFVDDSAITPEDFLRE